MALADLAALPAAAPLAAMAAPPGGPWSTDWQVGPFVLLLVVGLGAAYVWFTGAWRRRQSDPDRYPVRPAQRVAFFLGLALLLVALGPPLGDWATYYSLTAHMVQHMLLTLFVPPLLLLGTPAWMLRPLTRWRLTDRAGFLLTRMPVGLLASALVTMLFHVPSIMEVACTDPVIHAVERAAYLIAYTLFWWAIVGPLPEWPRLSEPLQCLTLFLQMLPMILVGAPITLADGILYPMFTEHVFGPFSIDPQVDQQVAGLLMWVLGMVGMLIPLSFIFLRWASRNDAEARGTSPARRPSAPRGAGD